MKYRAAPNLVSVLSGHRRIAVFALAVAGVAGVGACATGPTEVQAQSLPEIRMHARNQVPACVTPARLMRFLADQNPRPLPKFYTISNYYREHGERLGVRWDYAFFQMLLETNYLKFRNNSGNGDVNAAQNNFAGIGTTGGGVPGDRFPDVSTGVLAQMQHLIAYSGERVPNPVARRTREYQDHIISRSQRLRRPVTYRDLTGRWAIDSRYWRSISSIASRFRSQYCTGRGVADASRDRHPFVQETAMPARGAAPRVLAADGPATGRQAIGLRDIASVVPPPGLVKPPERARRPLTCRVFTASYGGNRNVLIRRRLGSEMQYTALQVQDGREQSLASAFISDHAHGGEAIEMHETRASALSRAFELCPDSQARGG